MDMLRVIQLNTLEDRSVHDKQEWDQAVKFFENSVKDKLKHTEETIHEMFGPSTTEKWVQWRSSTEDQTKRKHVKGELDKIINSDKKHPPTLSYDELTTVRKNLQRNNIEVETDYIRETWYPIYRRHFLKHALSRAYDLRKAYYLYTQQNENFEVIQAVLNGLVTIPLILFYPLDKLQRRRPLLANSAGHKSNIQCPPSTNCKS